MPSFARPIATMRVLTKLFMLGDVALWILVHGLDASDVGCIEHREADCEVMPQLERGVDAKVGQALPLFLAHMVAVRLVGPGNGCVPALAPNSVTGDRCDRLADLVVILDRILGLVRSGGFAARAFPQAQQRGIEYLLFGLGVNLEKGGEPLPHRGQAFRVGAIELLQDREQPALLLMVVQNELCNIHRTVYPSFIGQTPRPHGPAACQHRSRVTDKQRWCRFTAPAVHLLGAWQWV